MEKRKRITLDLEYIVTIIFKDDIEYLPSDTLKNIKELVNEAITDSGDVSCREHNVKTVCGNEMILSYNRKLKATVYEVWEQNYFQPDTDTEYKGYNIGKHTEELKKIMNNNRNNPIYEVNDCPEIKNIEYYEQIA